MTASRLARYRNLVRNVANWPVYWREKFATDFAPIEIHTRGEPLRFRVTSPALYLVFKELFVSDFYEISRLTSASIPTDATVIDVAAANGGYFSMLLLSRMPHARVFAFEPVDANCRLFRDNISLNPALNGRISVEQAAITGRPMASVELHRENASVGPASSRPVFADFAGQTANMRRCVPGGIAHGHRHAKHPRPRRPSQARFAKEANTRSSTTRPQRSWPSIPVDHDREHIRSTRSKRNPIALTRYLESLGYRCRSHLARNGCSALFATRR